jgi:putative membrane protein
MKINKPLTVLTTVAIVCGAILSMPAFAQKDTKLSDAEIASVAVTANQIDINYAKIAKEKSKNVEVLKFAKTMTDDHTAIINQAVALVTKLKVTPKDNAVSKQLLSDAEKTKKMLRSKSAKTFDKAYIDNEVAVHKAVIGTVESLLIPQSQNAELKKLLQDVVPALKAHLAHAEMLQKMFAKK